MGTEVLRPQDCLARQTPNLVARRRVNRIPNQSLSHKLLRKTPSPESRRRREGSPKVEKPLQRQKQLVMDEVTILKRGEPIEEAAARKEKPGVSGGNLLWDPMMFGTKRLGPEPAMMSKQIRVVPCRSNSFVEDGYAGSAFSISPSPRFLPLPSFTREENCAAAFDLSATVELRRLLRLQ